MVGILIMLKLVLVLTLVLRLDARKISKQSQVGSLDSWKESCEISSRKKNYMLTYRHSILLK